MNYYQAREIKTGPNKGRWHYTCKNGERIWPVGYCSPRSVCPACDGNSLVDAEYREQPCPTCQNRGAILVPQPCPGHDTAEQACEHYTAYLLDKRLRLNAGSTYAPCQAPVAGRVCGAHTDQFASVDGRSFDLCDTHRTREIVAELLGTVGASVSSM